MKAIVDVAPRGTVFDTAAMQLAAGISADYRLHFESARLLWKHLSGARLELLDTLNRQGACTVYALAKAAGRNYSNVHRDVAALEDLALIERDDEGRVFVPFDAVEVHMPLAKAA